MLRGLVSLAPRTQSALSLRLVETGGPREEAEEAGSDGVGWYTGTDCAWVPQRLSGNQSDKRGGSLPSLHRPRRGLGTVRTAETLPCWVVVNYSIKWVI